MDECLKNELSCEPSKQIITCKKLSLCDVCSKRKARKDMLYAVK